MAITISGENNNDRILASDGVIDEISGINIVGLLTASHLDVGNNIQLGNAGIITATTFIGNLKGNVNSTSPLLLQTDGGERFRITGNNELGIAGANYGSAGQVLTSGGSGNAVSWTTIAAQANISNNADNRIITGGSGVNLNGEANLTFDGSNLSVTGAANVAGTLIFQPGGTAWSTTNTRPQLGRQADGELRLGAGSDSSSIVTFYTSPSAGGTLTEKLRIASDGQATFDKGAPNSSNQVIARFQAESSRRLDIVWHDSGSLLGFDLPGSHSYIFKCAGSEKLRITSDGQVRIADANQGLRIGVDAANYKISRDPTGGDAGLLKFYGNQSGYTGYVFKGVDGERLRISSNGQISTRGATGTSFNNAGTGSFGSFLTVNGGHTSNQWGILSLEGNTSASGYGVGEIQFINQNNANGSSGASNQSRLLGKINVSSVTSDSNAGDDSGGTLQFFTKPEGGQPIQRLIIDSNGVVTISNSNPPSTGAMTFITDDGSATTLATQATLRVANNGGSADYSVFELESSQGSFRFTNDGKVNIGDHQGNPDAILHVIGPSGAGVVSIAQFGQTSSARYARFNSINNQQNFDHLLLSRYDNSTADLIRLQNTYAAATGYGSGIGWYGHGGGKIGGIKVVNRVVNSTAATMYIDVSGTNVMHLEHSPNRVFIGQPPSAGAFLPNCPNTPLQCRPSQGNTGCFAGSSTNYATNYGLLPWSGGGTYISSGITYENGVWNHQSADSTNCLFNIRGNGWTWYSSNNSSGSWNVANGVNIMSSAGVWLGGTSSDRRLKDNITNMSTSDALTKVTQLQGVSYTWKDEIQKKYGTDVYPEGTHYGFIAQDVKTVWPEAHIISDHDNESDFDDDPTKDVKDDVYYGEIEGVKLEKMVPLLVEAIKELKKENDALKTRVTTLEGS